MTCMRLLPLATLLLGLVAQAQTPPAAPPPAPAGGPVKYALSDGKGVYVQVFKDPTTLASDLSHDHVMQATGWTGSMTWDPASPATCAIDISLPVAKLAVDPANLRKAVGYTSELDDDQRGEIREHMLDEGQLNGSAHPNITFKASKCELAGDTLKVTGGITIRGKTKNLTVPMKFSADGKTLKASGTFTARATEFGFEPFSALLGALKNKDEMKFTVDVVGKAP